MASDMTRRVAFAAVAIPVAIVVVWFGGAPLAALVAAASVLGTRELLDFGRRQGLRPWTAFALAVAGAAGPLTWAVTRVPRVAQAVDAAWPYAGGLLLVTLLLGTLARLRPDGRPLGSAALSLLAPLYAGVLPAFLIGIRHAGHGERSWAGTALVFFPLALTWACDSLAMEVGRRIGGPKLWPAVSPGKTWSGALGGLAGALLAAPLLRWAMLDPAGVTLPLGPALAIALAVGTLGQLGDLAESLFKREAGLKDSSALIPGHGGVLDRFDSLYVVLPVTAALYRCFGVA
jgi:phosphatidate cytidylyltransferase